MVRTAGASLGTAREIVVRVLDARLSFLAAATAYYAFVSLFPLLLLAVAVGSLVGGDAIADRVVAAIGGVLTAGGQDLLRETLAGEAGRGGATVLGIAVLAWSGSRVFRGLALAFATVYGTESETTFLSQLRTAGLALLALGVAVGAVAVGAVAVGRTGVALGGLVRSVGIVLALAIVLLPLYVVIPHASVGVHEAIPGAVTAAAGWTLLSTLFGVYAANAGQFDVYGVVGAVLLFVTWLYVGATVLLVGAVVNAVLAGRDRQLQLPPRHTLRRDATMTGTDDDPAVDGDGADAGEDGGLGTHAGDDPGSADDPAAEIAALRDEIDRLESEIDDRTVHREEVEGDLRRYVRRRVRRGHAHGWGPYLVLLYGTAMTLGAFYYLEGGWAVLAMLVVWLSTLGLYVLMVLVGLTFKLLGSPGRLIDRVRDWRS